MGKRIDLPSGGWAELREDLEDFRAKDRKRIIAQANLGSETFTEVQQSLDLSVAVVAWAVERYQLDYRPFNSAVRITPTIEDIEEMRPADLDEITVACKPVLEMIFPSKPTPDDQTPGSPTPPAGA